MVPDWSSTAIGPARASRTCSAGGTSTYPFRFDVRFIRLRPTNLRVNRLVTGIRSFGSDRNSELVDCTAFLGVQTGWAADLGGQKAWKEGLPRDLSICG